MSHYNHLGRRGRVGGSLPKGATNLSALFSILKGGAGSGNRGHAGIPGHRGGSAPQGSVGVVNTSDPSLASEIKNLIKKHNIPKEMLEGLTITDQPHKSIPNWISMGAPVNGFYDKATNTLGVNPERHEVDVSYENTLLHEMGHRFQHMANEGKVDFPKSHNEAIKAIGFHLKKGENNPNKQWEMSREIKKEYGFSYAGFTGHGEMLAEMFTLSRMGTPQQKSNLSDILNNYNQGNLEMYGGERWLTDRSKVPTNLVELMGGK